MVDKRRSGMGPDGDCVCLGCGSRVPHRRGVPCMEERCPHCGKAMLREGGEHHQEAISRRREKSDA